MTKHARKKKPVWDSMTLTALVEERTERQYGTKQCWQWTHPFYKSGKKKGKERNTDYKIVNDMGTPVIRYGGKFVDVRRFWFIKFNLLNPSQWLKPKCGNSLCVNPQHMVIIPNPGYIAPTSPKHKLTDKPIIISSRESLSKKQAAKKQKRDEWLEEEKRYQEILRNKQQ
jgi:hypothetical protein